MAICYRRDIDDDQGLDGIRVRKGKLHGDLAAHGMAHDDGVGQPLFGNEPGDVLGHFGIRHGHRALRRSVIAKIERIDMMRVGKAARMPGPVAGRAEKAVKHDQRRAVGAVFVELQFDHAGWRIMLPGTCHRGRGLTFIPAA